MNGKNNIPVEGLKPEDKGNKHTDSILGALAVQHLEELVPEHANERVERAKAHITEIREICEAEVTFQELIIRGTSGAEEDSQPHIKLVWGGRSFPLYEHNRIVTYTDEAGNENPLLVTVTAKGSYALKADVWPPSEGNEFRENIKLQKFLKKVKKTGFWGLDITVAMLKDTLDPESDRVVYSTDGSREYIANTKNQEVFTMSLKSSDMQSIFRSIDADDLAQLSVLADLIKSSTHV